MEKKIHLGDRWCVSETTVLSKLILEGEITAPEGKQLTLTVDGVHRDLAPGEYIGKVYLETKHRPRFIVREYVGDTEDE